MELALRLAALPDVPAMHRIRTSVTENILSDGSTFGHDDYVPFLSSDGETWVAELDDQMAGFGAIDRRDSSIWALFVAPEFESRGVGKALLNQLVQRAQLLGMRALHLTTTPGTRAEQFYIRQGWQLAGTAPKDEVLLQYNFDAALSEGF